MLTITNYYTVEKDAKIALVNFTYQNGYSLALIIRRRSNVNNNKLL